MAKYNEDDAEATRAVHPRQPRWRSFWLVRERAFSGVVVAHNLIPGHTKNANNTRRSARKVNTRKGEFWRKGAQETASAHQRNERAARIAAISSATD